MPLLLTVTLLATGMAAERALFWHEQSGFNHNEWTDYGERLIHSNCNPNANTDCCSNSYAQRLHSYSDATATPTATATVQVTVQTNPAGLSFTVDTITYSSTQTFSWVPGSSHTIATTSPQSGGTGVRYVWTNWSGGGAISHTVAPTTNKTYTATFNTQYYLTMSHEPVAR